MNKICAILPIMLGLVLAVPSSESALAEPIPSPVPASNLAQATTSLSNLTGQYVVQGQDAEGSYTGVAWIQTNTAGDKVEVHWSIDRAPNTPDGMEEYVGVGGLNAGNLEVTYVGPTTYSSGTQTFTVTSNGTLQATFNYTAPDGQPATGSETLIPVSNISLSSTP